ncbi:hypothetical protein [Streptomyces chiangmaiensis]|uniref:Uncharacterized protein n=1 Tax=Streptomyces chiangmaiensis TaxID=766497 RepID=A0ABU7FWD1_9ACTN|nr:hypothetical protein [Streptomyces chiangmaiensis]MED7828202.1 hypothetical protein [Streptomyces chiangmaiensis]
MSDARADAIYEYHTASDNEFNEAAADKQKWVDRIEKVGERGFPGDYAMVTVLVYAFAVTSREGEC